MGIDSKVSSNWAYRGAKVTDDVFDFIFDFGGAVLFFLFTGCWLGRSTHVVCDVVSVGCASSVRGT